MEIYAQMPSPKAVVAVGSCPASGNVFAGSPSITGPLDKYIPVDVWVPGSPPSPFSLLYGLLLGLGRLPGGQLAGAAR